VRIALLACLFLATSWSACGYDDRDFDGVSFACDLFHPCPDGAPCLAGRCPISGGGGGSNLGRQGIQCGGAFCSLGASCCDDLSSSFCGAPGVCAAIELRCDGQEDCSGGTSCCFEGGLASCQASCPTRELCSSNADCAGNPDGATFCCSFPTLDLLACRPFRC
jgi:hypothetical protein